jgi:phosphosulfolactate phosphohydrolase-like enzyme
MYIISHLEKTITGPVHSGFVDANRATGMIVLYLSQCFAGVLKLSRVVMRMVLFIVD